jgi:hypothetical protein
MTPRKRPSMVDEHDETARKSPRMRFTIRRMMVMVAIAALVLVVVKTLFIDIRPRDLLIVAISLLDGSHSTIYADGYSESSFRSIRVGMPMCEVEVIMGPPLYKGQWIVGVPGQPVLLDGPRDDYWSYTRAGKVRGDYWQRQVFFRNGIVHSTESSYYMD